MILHIKISLDGAAFEDNQRDEIRFVLAQLPEDPTIYSREDHIFRDSNGNTCGIWRLSE